jgi:hypothetical protein
MTATFNPARIHEHSFHEISQYITNINEQLDLWKQIAYRVVHNQPLSTELARVFAAYLAEKGDIK